MKVYDLDCKRCPLHKTAYTVGMDGYVGNTPKLAIFLDYPNREEDQRHRIGASDSTKLVFWLLDRMSVSHEDVTIQFTLKCSAPKDQVRTKAQRVGCIESCSSYRFAILQRLKPKAIVSMGKISCEAFLNGVDQSKREGMKWRTREPNVFKICPEVWIAYSPGYSLQTPSETGRLYRVLFKAAESIGLNPQHNPNVKEFKFDV